METSIDDLIANKSNNELTRTYLKSLFNQYELDVIREMFESRKDGRVHAGMNNNIFVELSKRKNGYYAWLVVNERSSMLINPNVAILHTR
jgi:endo-1,4-beta-mannosidase